MPAEESTPMSYQAVQWVLYHSQARGVDRLVLLAIAWYAGIDEWSAWPTIDHIAEKAAVSRRAVFRSLEHLVTLGELEIIAGRGRGIPNRYRIPYEKMTHSHPSDEEKVPTRHKKVTETTKKGATAGTQKSQEESIQNQNGKGDNQTPKDQQPTPTRCTHCHHPTWDCTCHQGPTIAPQAIRDTLNRLRGETDL